MFFDGIFRELRELRVAQGEDPSRFSDLVFLDDVATMIVAPRLPELRGSACGNPRNARRAAGEARPGYTGREDAQYSLSPEGASRGVFQTSATPL